MQQVLSIPGSTELQSCLTPSNIMYPDVNCKHGEERDSLPPSAAMQDTASAAAEVSDGVPRAFVCSHGNTFCSCLPSNGLFIWRCAAHHVLHTSSPMLAI